MKTFSRLKNIIHSNVNSALNSMENPEKMIRLMIVDLEETLFKVKKSMSSRITEKKMLEKEIKDQKERIQRWTDRAKLAVEKNRDDLAKEALAEKKTAESRIVEIKERFKSIESIVMNEEESIAQLSSKLKEIKEKQNTLVNRAKHVKEKIKVQETIRDTESDDLSERFNDLEAKIEQMEAEANIFSSGSSSNEFEEMEVSKEIDEELEALKESMKKGSK